MNAVALVESVDHVCVRYRLAPFRPALESAGHTLELVPLAKNLYGRWKQYQSASRFDAVILQRTLLSSLELAALRRHAKRLIFDFDDAIWRRDSYSRKSHSGKRARRFANVVRQADCIIAGNEFLASKANRATVVPSCIGSGAMLTALREHEETGHFTPPCEVPHMLTQSREHGTRLGLVWIGSSSTLRSLEQIRPTLEAIGRAFPEVRLKLICDRFARFDPLKIENVTWSATTEADEISSSDVGIAWMPDDDWSRGKCGVKVLQYLAAGLPVIANPVGVHTAMVRNDETGFLANSTEDWIAAVGKLRDANLRGTLGANGRRLVEDKYCVDVGAMAWCGLFDRLSMRKAC